MRRLWLLMLSAAIVLLARSPWLASQGRLSVQQTEGLAHVERGEANEAYQWWYSQRAYPHDEIPKDGLTRAARYVREQMSTAAPEDGALRDAPLLQSIGPNNVAGRMLSLAIHPTNPNIIWAGSAGGGLWKSTTAGAGAQGWQRVLGPVSTPMFAVSAIAIHPTQPNTIYVGTGEMGRTQPGQIGVPGARAAYGIGVLKTTNGGATWSNTGLDWELEQNRCVQTLRIDPSNPNVVWAATSEGVYRSSDGGVSWVLRHPIPMAMDLELHPTAPNTIFVAHGQLGIPSDSQAGIYRTTDGGGTWLKLTSGLPSANRGRTDLSITSTAPFRMWAAIVNSQTHGSIGLYQSYNLGDTWLLRSSVNWAGDQGWYNNAVAAIGGDWCLFGGIELHFTNGAFDYIVTSAGRDEGLVQPGDPEGPDNYVHPDCHALVGDPARPDTVWAATDGGIFVTTDHGSTWASRNGGLATTQFYPGFATGSTNPLEAQGGTQDNGTLLYFDDPAWWTFYYGGILLADGSWGAIHPSDPNTAYASAQYGNVWRTTTGPFPGANWSELRPFGMPGNVNFIAPLVLSESHPNVLYTGTQGLLVSTDAGDTWNATDGDTNWNGTPLSTIGLSFTSPDTLMASTGGRLPWTIEIRRSVDGGQSFVDVSAQLPNRFCTDFAYDPSDSRRIWATFSGYGTPHIFFSSDAGLTWANRSSNLPDVPTQAAAVHPGSGDYVYVGTDLGLFRAVDGGFAWEGYNAHPTPGMITDLVFQEDAPILRVATFGAGVFEAGPLELPSHWRRVSPPVGDGVHSFGVAWADFDVDGDIDLYSANSGTPRNLLWRNDGDLGFAEATPPTLEGYGVGCGVSWGDYDNDGDPDCYVAEGGVNILARNDGGGVFADVTAPPLDLASVDASVAWVDYDLDGDLDLSVSGDLPRLFRNDGGAFVDATDPLFDIFGSRIALWADYDGDGDSDAFVLGYLNGRLVRNDGGSFADVTGDDFSSWFVPHSGSWGDFDNDSDLDLFGTSGLDPFGSKAAHSSLPPDTNHLFRNDGSSGFAEVVSPEFIEVGFGSVLLDFDNDADLDIMVVHPGWVHAVRNDGDGVFSSEYHEDLQNPFWEMLSAAAGDYDGDGDLDLYVAGVGDELFQNVSATGNHWLHLSLVGGQGNRSAIGARVRVVAGGVSQIREVEGCSGYLSQSSLAVEFGLATAAIADSVIITWPFRAGGGMRSNVVTVFTNVAADRAVTVTESGGFTDAPIIVGTTDVPRLTLRPGFPNPFSRETTIAFDLPRPGAVQLDVLDVAGRRVRSLERGPLSAGQHSVRWDGRDQTGRQTGVGVYFVRLETTDGQLTRKVIRVR